MWFVLFQTLICILNYDRLSSFYIFNHLATCLLSVADWKKRHPLILSDSDKVALMQQFITSACNSFREWKSSSYCPLTQVLLKYTRWGIAWKLSMLRLLPKPLPFYLRCKSWQWHVIISLNNDWQEGMWSHLLEYF